MNIQKNEILALVDKYSDATKEHLLQVGACMEYFAEKLWEDSEYWWSVWVLHDIDRDYVEKDGTKHLKDALDMIGDKIAMSDEMKWDIRSHGYFLEGISEQPDTLVRKYLCAVDELSGFMWAYFRMLPSDDVMEIKVKSIKKKIKDKSFAAWVDRHEVKNCENLLDIPLDEFIEDMKHWLKRYTQSKK